MTSVKVFVNGTFTLSLGYFIANYFRKDNIINFNSIEIVVLLTLVLSGILAFGYIFNSLTRNTGLRAEREYNWSKFSILVFFYYVYISIFAYILSFLYYQAFDNNFALALIFSFLSVFIIVLKSTNRIERFIARVEGWLDRPS